MGGHRNGSALLGSHGMRVKGPGSREEEQEEDKPTCMRSKAP